MMKNQTTNANCKVEITRWGKPRLGLYKYKIYTPNCKDHMTVWLIECFGFSIGGHLPSWL